MPVNAAGRRAVISLHNQDGMITLLELSHPTFATRRLALSDQDVVHNGNTFMAFNFEVDYPTDEHGIPTGRIRVTNVTKEVWTLVRNIKDTPPQINLIWVPESDVNTPQDQWQLFDVRTITATIRALEAQISHELYANEPYPSLRMTGKRFYWMNYW